MKCPLIVFCGVDGSGKSTLAKELKSKLDRRNIQTSYVHGHTFVASGDSFGIGDTTVVKFRYLFRMLIPLAILDNYYDYLITKSPVLKKNILICDRYYYDKLARMMYYGIANKTIAKLYLKLIPKPDCIFFLHVDEKIAVQRKGEYDLAETAAFQKIYSFLAQQINAPTINTNQPLDTSINTIVNYVLKKAGK